MSWDQFLQVWAIAGPLATAGIGSVWHWWTDRKQRQDVEATILRAEHRGRIRLLDERQRTLGAQRAMEVRLLTAGYMTAIFDLLAHILLPRVEMTEKVAVERTELMQVASLAANTLAFVVDENEARECLEIVDAVATLQTIARAEQPAFLAPINTRRMRLLRTLRAKASALELASAGISVPTSPSTMPNATATTQ